MTSSSSSSSSFNLQHQTSVFVIVVLVDLLAYYSCAVLLLIICLLNIYYYLLLLIIIYYYLLLFILISHIIFIWSVNHHTILCHLLYHFINLSFIIFSKFFLPVWASIPNSYLYTLVVFLFGCCLIYTHMSFGVAVWVISVFDVLFFGLSSICSWFCLSVGFPKQQRTMDVGLVLK